MTLPFSGTATTAHNTLMKLNGWLRDGKRVAVARVIDVLNSAPQPLGALLAIAETGEVVGAATGGCVEVAIIEAARALLAGEGEPRCLRYGPAAVEGWGVGLTCGGEVRVFLEVLPSALDRDPDSLIWDALLQDVCGGRGVAFVEIVEGPISSLSAKALVSLEMRSLSLGGLDGRVAEAVRRDAVFDLDAGRCGLHHYGDGSAGERVSAFVQPFPAPPVLIIVGASGFAPAVARQAKLLGYRVVLCDPRRAFASAMGISEVDEIRVEWPDRYVRSIGVTLTARDAICVLTHDSKFDVPAILAALSTEVGYIGLMGSRRTQADRTARLERAGISATALTRLHGPLGLDIGAQTAEETAVSICAEIIAARNGGTGRPLAAGDGPIHRPTCEAGLAHVS